ncbi:MAG: hypothetical protein JOY82_01715 [Streptosporangiaceae bacterium]|nr:hypothetical protein [Streptosporangiaceae bacterium]MBV9853230.1 hypothetical protein [Streptosporangiaceae bacterium]
MPAIRSRISGHRPRMIAITTVSAVPANSQGPEPASVISVPSSAGAGPDDVMIFSQAHATRNVNGGHTATGSRLPGRT